MVAASATAMSFVALQAGSSGYLTKDADRDTILHAVRTAAQGQTILAPVVQRRPLALASRRMPTAPPQDDGIELTPREREILGLIGEGLRNRRPETQPRR
jgi:DNA-binding NarL/FixJ family response regulator